MTSLPTPARLAAAVAALTIVAALSGCSVLETVFPAEAQRSEETQEISKAGQQDVFDVAVGDCFNEDGGGEDVSDVPAVPCVEPHDNEVFHLFDLTGDVFPVDIDEQADAGCMAQFAAFVGIEYDASTEIDFFTISPSADTWSEGDREVICSVFDIDKQTTGTLAGAAR
jgi:hypothetical protein